MRLMNIFKRSKLQIPSTFTKEFMNELAIRFNTTSDKLIPLRIGESIIFNIANKGILRISPASQQDAETIEAKLYFQNYLYKNDARVVPVFTSANKKLVEKITLGNSYYTAALFEKAEGEIITDKFWDNSIFYEMGKLTAKIHSLSKFYTPPANNLKHLIWHNTESQKINSQLPNSEEHLIKKFNNYLEEVKTINISINSFGLIHNDIHRGNLFLYKDKITLFDFDDLTYSWFLNDVACILYNALLHHKKNVSESQFYIKNFMQNFWQGYHINNKLDFDDLSKIPALLSMRAISIYAYLNKNWDVKNLNHAQQNYFNLNKMYAEENFLLMNLNLLYP